MIRVFIDGIIFKLDTCRWLAKSRLRPFRVSIAVAVMAVPLLSQ
jgi:hypothetical protein